jgi:sulfite exporter TauE/SafE
MYNMLSVLLIGFSMGFLGSFHCVGMCGPIALSIPISNNSKARRMLSIVLYNLGRATTYGLMGLCFGLLGNQFFLTGYQQIFSVVLGSIILLIWFLEKFIHLERTIFAPWHLRLQQAIAKFLWAPKKTSHNFLIGLLNGLLPCGFVYLAIASATATGSAGQGAALMFAFGLGTIPLLFTLMVLGKAIGFELRVSIKKAMPYAIACTACLLILRGLNLGIPFISPMLLHNANTTAISCGNH